MSNKPMPTVSMVTGPKVISAKLLSRLSIVSNYGRGVRSLRDRAQMSMEWRLKAVRKVFDVRLERGVEVGCGNVALRGVVIVLGLAKCAVGLVAGGVVVGVAFAGLAGAEELEGVNGNLGYEV